MDRSGDVEAHPYDNAYKVMKELKGQVTDLRAALLAEQQQRASEVMELRMEMMEMKKDLPKRCDVLKSQILQISIDLATWRSKDKGLEDLKVQNRQMIAQLNNLLQDEIQDRKSHQQIFEAKLSSHSAEFKQDNEAIQMDFTALSNGLGHHKEDHTNRINELTHDVHQVVNYLRKVGTAWNVFSPGGQQNDADGADGKVGRA